MSFDKTTLEKLKKILKVSVRIKMEQMRNILEMDQKTFDKKIIDWADEFGFTIDGDYISISKESVDDFINALDAQFKSWEHKEAGRLGKIEDYIVKRTDQADISPSKKMDSDSREKLDYFVKLGKDSFNSKQYQKALIYYQEARKMCEKLLDVNLTLEIDQLISQVETSISREPEEKLNRIVFFRETSISQFEANALKELERITEQKFSLVDKGDYENEMGFFVENNRVIELGLYNCELSTLPELIENLKSLQVLHLGENRLSTLPESIGELKSLQKLYLFNNQANNLPESIGNLYSLNELDLNGNNFSTLPESIGQLKLLTRLYLNNNKFKTLPESIGNLYSLKELELYENQLTTLPESITQLKSLQNIDLGLNKLSTLPESLGNLKSLITLNISNNQLSTLPDSIRQLSSLKNLYLSDNQFTTLPESVKVLKLRGVKIF